jgi:cell division protease FtsH
MSTKEKRIVAFHEIGHALVAAMQKGSDPVLKITIIPRTMGSLGYTMQVPEDDKYLMSKDEMLNEIAVLFGGRAAEEVEFDSITTGASNDIERATQMARRMVSMYGMSESFDMMGLESIRSQYLDGRAVLNVSDETATKIDIETLNIIRACHEKAKQILMENKELMTVLAEQLLEKETMTGNEFMTVVRQFKGDAFGRKLPAPEVIEATTEAAGEAVTSDAKAEEADAADASDGFEGQGTPPEVTEGKDLLEDLKETLKEEQEKGSEETGNEDKES